MTASKELTCPHPTLYALDMFDQPRPWGACPLCERDEWKAEFYRKAEESTSHADEALRLHTELERPSAIRLQAALEGIVKLEGKPLTIAQDIARCALAGAAHEPAVNVAPIAKIYVSTDGKLVAGELYAPGLPAGYHDLSPVPLNPRGNLREWPSPPPPVDEGEIHPSTRELQAGLLNPAEQVMFRAGLLACRAYMAAFVRQGGDGHIADSILANWWPSLGEDPGQPRKNTFQELTVGEYGEPGFRTKTREELSPSIEALPMALGFLQCHCGWPEPHYSTATKEV